MDDQTLAASLAADLDAAFETLVRSHVDRLYSIALRILGDTGDAEEAAQDALVRAYRAIATYDAERVRDLRLRPWLATIVVNVCRSRWKRRQPRGPSLEPLIEAGVEPAADDSSDPAALAARTATRRQLTALVSQLPERYRVPVVLRHVDDLSYAEVAEVLGRPEGTVKAQVHRGLAMLRSSLDATDREELTA